MIATVSLVVTGLVILVGPAELEVDAEDRARREPVRAAAGVMRSTDPATLSDSGGQWPRQS
ncbi:hypothetical protein [Nocardia sp. MW-W600-9]